MELNYLLIDENDRNLYHTLCYVHTKQENCTNKEEFETVKNVLKELIYRELYLDDDDYLHKIDEDYPMLFDDYQEIIKRCYTYGLKYEIFLSAIEKLVESAKVRMDSFDIINDAVESLNENSSAEVAAGADPQES